MWRDSHSLTAAANKHCRLKLLRAARRAVSHWRGLAKNGRKVRGVMEKMSAKAELKNYMLRWRKFYRMCALTASEESDATDRAYLHYFRHVFWLFRSGAAAARLSREQRVEEVRRLVSRKQKVIFFRLWSVKYTVLRLGRTSLLRRTYQTWKVLHTARAAAAAFWESATLFCDQRLVGLVFRRWSDRAKTEKKQRREARAVSVLLRLGAAGKNFVAFSKWKGTWTAWRDNRENSRKALQHRFYRLTLVSFRAWTERVLFSKTVKRILPMLSSSSRSAKIMYGLAKWRSFVESSRRDAKLQMCSHSIMQTFMTRLASKRAATYFDGWKKFSKKRARCKVLKGIVERRVAFGEKSSLFRNWTNAYLRTKAKVWEADNVEFNGDESEAGAKADLRRLSAQLAQAQSLAIEEMESEKEAEQELAHLQGECIAKKLELDSANSKVHLLGDELHKLGRDFAKVEAKRLKKVENLAETKLFMKVLRDRPDSKKYSTINGAGDETAERAREKGKEEEEEEEEEEAREKTSGARRLLQEKLELEVKKADLERFARNLKRAIAAVKKKKGGAEKEEEEAKRAREAKEKEGEERIGRLRAKKDKTLGEVEEGENALRTEKAKVGELQKELWESFDRMGAEEGELKERVEVARRREEEIEKLIWRRNVELRGLREELRVGEEKRGKGGKGAVLSENRMELLRGNMEHQSEVAIVKAKEARELSALRCREVKAVLDEGGYVYMGGGGENEEEDGGKERRSGRSGRSGIGSARSENGATAASVAAAASVDSAEERLLRKIGVLKTNPNAGNAAAVVVSTASSRILAKAKRETGAALHRMSAAALLTNLGEEERWLDTGVSSRQKELDRKEMDAGVKSRSRSVEALTQTILSNLVESD